LRSFANSPWVDVSPAHVADGELVLALRTVHQVDHLHFTVPPGFHAHPDLVAAAVAPLVHSRHERIRFNFAVSSAVQELIARRTRAKVSTEGTIEPRQAGSTTALNFSGGMDSLAAWLLAPHGVKRVAIDFGAWFRRERRFFDTLDPDVVCRTDIRAKGYARNDWLFMGSVAMLFADHLDLGAMGFGTMFDSTPSNFNPAGWDISARRRSPQPALAEAIGLREYATTRGLTVFGGSMVVDAFRPDLAERSLGSLARHRSEKSFRKRLAFDTAAAFRRGAPVDLDALQLPYREIEIGTSYSADFATLAFMTLYPPEFVQRFVRHVERGTLDAARTVRPDFLFRYNPMFIDDIPGELRPTVLRRLAEAGVEMYRDDDWAEYEKFRRILGQHHSLPG
jgi:hypothetical protein